MLRPISFVLAVLAASAALAVEPTFPPGSRIGLVPPKNMKPARGVAGFQDPATGAAIVAVEMPSAAFQSEALGVLAAHGLRVRYFPAPVPTPIAA